MATIELNPYRSPSMAEERYRDCLVLSYYYKNSTYFHRIEWGFGVGNLLVYRCSHRASAEKVESVFGDFFLSACSHDGDFFLNPCGHDCHWEARPSVVIASKKSWVALEYGIDAVEKDEIMALVKDGHDKFIGDIDEVVDWEMLVQPFKDKRLFAGHLVGVLKWGVLYWPETTP